MDFVLVDLQPSLNLQVPYAYHAQTIVFFATTLPTAALATVAALNSKMVSVFAELALISMALSANYALKIAFLA